ncbi:MAG: hypothetical protein ACRYF0_00570 [Janthinobacterium lividum]
MVILYVLTIQKASSQVGLTDRYASFHEHTTYKWYYRTIQNPDIILAFSDAELKSKYGKVNWQPYGVSSTARRTGKESHLQNYDQVSYNELRHTPGSIICTSFYPYEKAILDNSFNRFIDHIWVSRMSRARLNIVADDSNYAFKEFLAEYRFAVNQDENNAGATVHFARNKADLLDYNSRGITTTVMSIEGAHTFYGPTISRSTTIRDWQCDGTCEDEILANINAARNLEHRLFFVTVAHFTWNRIAGNAKTLDKFGLRRFLASTLAKNEDQRKKLFLKWGEGIHGDIDVGDYLWTPPTPGSPYVYPLPITANIEGQNHRLAIGRKAILALLTPRPGTKHPEPTYVDVKHMDIQARTEYYQMRDSLSRAWGINIPIIASHVAASGEDLSIARATGLNPRPDQYPELANPLAFYNEQLKPEWDKKWKAITSYKSNSSEPVNPWHIGATGRNPFSGHINNATAGWFYPWSMNLYDEEIPRIHNSDGIMGVMLDGRQLGARMKNYTGAYWHTIRVSFNQKISSLNSTNTQLTFAEYKELEPFFRNIIYLVNHCSPDGKPCWKHVALGTDFDGLIDPLDVCPTASSMPTFKIKAALALALYCSIHEDALAGVSAAERIEQLFYTNGQRFITTYF